MTRKWWASRIYCTHTHDRGEENYTTQVTENPLESGAIVNDHLITDPYTISMTGVITKEHVEGVENFGIVGEWWHRQAL